MATATIPTVTRVTPIVEIGVGSERDAEGIVALWQQDVNNDGIPDVAGFAVTRWQPTEPTVGTNEPTSHWVGDQPFYIDVSCHVREISTFSGRERADETWEVGTATITVDNADGWADYPLGDPDQLLSMRPGREVRIGVLVDGTTAHYLWAGFIDGMEPGYDPEDGEFVTFECIDAKGEAGRPFLGELAAGVGLNETGTARIGRILDAVGWFPSRRSVASTSVQLKATTLDAQAVDLLDLAADSVGGAVFGDVQGRVAFRGRDWQAVSVTAPPDGTISNDIQGNPTAVCPVNWELSFNREDVATKVVLGRPGEVPFTATNVAAFRLYGEETFERTDLETRLDADIVTLRDRILEVRSPTHMPRIAAVTLDAGTDPAVVDVLAAVSPFKPSIVYCKHRGTNGRTVINKAMMVVGVEHTLTPEGWSARLSLDNAKPFQVGANDGRWSDGTAVTAQWQPTEPAVGTFITRWSEGV
jgi:hypothetical protein